MSTSQGGEADPYAPDSVAVYQLFNDAGALLYVGITSNPKVRFIQHAADKPWWWQVASWHVDWYPNRERAAEAEAAMIRNRLWLPAYNIAGATTEGAERGFVERWTEVYTNVQPRVADLNYFFVHMARTKSLGADARVAWTASDVEAVYLHVLANAKPRDVREHQEFVDEWNRRRLARCMARDERRRQDDARPRDTALQHERVRRPRPAEDRDLLIDVMNAFGRDDIVGAADMAARLRSLAPRFGPYRSLNGTQLAQQLRSRYGIEVRQKKGITVIRRERVEAAFDRIAADDAAPV